MKLHQVFFIYYAAGACYIASAATSRSKAALVRFILPAGILLNILFLAGRAFSAGIFLPLAIVEEPYILPLCLAVLHELTRRKLSEDNHAPALIPLVALFWCASLFCQRWILPPSAKSDTLFCFLFFLTETAAHACFFAAAWFAARHIWRDDAGKLYHSIAVWGFVLFSASQISGAIWCYLGWSAPFMWSNRHLQTAAVWVLYANYIHLRFIEGWSHRKKAWLLMAGATIVLTFAIWGLLVELTMHRVGG